MFVLLFDVKILLFDAEFPKHNPSLLSFAAALIYSEVPAADQSEGQTKSCIEFTVKETNEKVMYDISLILYFAVAE